MSVKLNRSVTPNRTTGSVSSPGSMGHPTGSTNTAGKKPAIYQQDLQQPQASPTPRVADGCDCSEDQVDPEGDEETERATLNTKFLLG